MRGAGDSLSTGERIAFYRARRGLTQTQLANLVGRRVDWLSKIERGARQLRNLDLLAEVAKILRVSLTDLMGQPALMEDNDERDDIPAIRDALMSPGRLSRVLYSSPEPATELDLGRSARLVEYVWADYQNGRLGHVVDQLPGLIRAAQRLEDGARTTNSPSTAWAISARTHHLAATTLSKVGEADLSWIAAERAMRAADEADDPLVLASAARAATHALLAIGRYEDALNLGETAARWLGPKVRAGDPAAEPLRHAPPPSPPLDSRTAPPQPTSSPERHEQRMPSGRTATTGRPDSAPRTSSCTASPPRSTSVTSPGSPTTATHLGRTQLRLHHRLRRTHRQRRRHRRHRHLRPSRRHSGAMASVICSSPPAPGLMRSMASKTATSRR